MDPEHLERVGPADRRGDPLALWPEAGSVIMLGLNYGPAGDPLARGACGKTRCGPGGAQMGDFIDAVIAPDGRPYAVFVDVCSKACVTDPKVHKDGALAMVGTLATGARLRGEGLLTPLAPPKP